MNPQLQSFATWLAGSGRAAFEGRWQPLLLGRLASKLALPGASNQALGRDSWAEIIIVY